MRGEKYSAIEFSNLVAGRLTVRPEGFGFVLADEGEDLYVPRAGMHGAMDGDTVLAREERSRATGRGRGRAPRRSGVVVRVLERVRERVVGRFETQEGRKVVVPYDPKIDAVIRIADGKSGGAREGEIVQVRLTAFPDARRVAYGEVDERLGFLGEPGVDIEIVLRSHNLPPRFPQPVVEESERYPEQVRPEDLRGRRDFRERRIVTIDGETAKDFDDAIEAERTAGGLSDRHSHRGRLPLRDRGRRSRRRGPFARHLGLLPGPRPPDAAGAPLERALLAQPARRPARALGDPGSRLPRTRRRFRVCEGSDPQRPPHDVHGGRPPPRVDADGRATSAATGRTSPTFRLMGEVAARLRERREARGSIDFDLPDADVVLDDEGLVVGIVPEARNVAHRLIEEFMLAANEAVAKKLLFAKQPAIYRVHDRPDPDRLVDLKEVLEGFGYELKGDLAEVPPSAFQRLLAQIEGKPEERLLHDLLLRAQRKALYAEECRGHYALAAPYYCHFTSPIRRYPDLIVHRQLSRLLEAGRPVAAKDFDTVNDRMREVAAFSSERERRAEKAERESLLWKKIVFMKDKLEREFDAYVTGVASFGAFVTLKDYFVEGLVPIQSLGNDFFVYEEKQHRLRGRSSGQTYRLGDSIRVQPRRDRRGPPPTQLPPRGRGGEAGGGRSAPARAEGVRPPAARAPELAMRSAARRRSLSWPCCSGRVRAEKGVGPTRTSGWPCPTSARRRRRPAAAATPPARPDPPRGTSGSRGGLLRDQAALEGLLQRPGGRDRRSPRGRNAPSGSVARRTRRRLSAGLLDGGRSPDLRRCRAPESRRPDHRLREGPEIFGGWIFTRFPDVHPFSHPRFKLQLEGGVPRTGSDSTRRRPRGVIPRPAGPRIPTRLGRR